MQPFPATSFTGINDNFTLHVFYVISQYAEIHKRSVSRLVLFEMIVSVDGFHGDSSNIASTNAEDAKLEASIDKVQKIECM